MSEIWQACLNSGSSTSTLDIDKVLGSGVAEGERGDAAFNICRVLRDRGVAIEDARTALLDWNKLNRPPIKDRGWPHAQLKSTYNFSNTYQRHETPITINNLLNNHNIFRSNLLSDAEFRCVVTMLSKTNIKQKVWKGNPVKPGQFITSLPNLGSAAHPRSVKEPETAARNAILKLKREGVLKKVQQLKNNLGILYEWEGGFAKVFQTNEYHTHESPLEITLTDPVTNCPSEIYEDDRESLITPIDRLIMSSTKNINHRRN